MMDIDNQIEQLQGKHEEKQDIQDDIVIIDLQRKKARRRNSQEQAQQLQTKMNDLQQQLQQLDGSVDVTAKTSLHKLIHRHEPLLLLTNDRMLFRVDEDFQHRSVERELDFGRLSRPTKVC